MSSYEDQFTKTDYHPPERCEVCGDRMKYKGVGEYACEKCGHLMYDDYGVVRNYLEMYPGATSGMVSMETGVDEKTIKNMIREERLSIREDSRSFIQCLGCGKSITFGKYCDQCGRIASAAARRKKEKEILEYKKQNIQGVSADYPVGESGRKRFIRNDDE